VLPAGIRFRASGPLGRAFGMLWGLGAACSSLPRRAGSVALQPGSVSNASSATAPEASSTFFVGKVHSSESLRFVFAAGLEGTAHHAFVHLKSACKQERLCVYDPDLSAQLWNLAIGVMANQSEETAAAQEQVVLTSFERHRAESSAEGRLVLLHSTFNSTTEHLHAAMYSYPKNGGEDKPLRHPDVEQMARLAERASVDLRLVLLQRDVRDTLVSAALHRGFGDSLGHEAAILADNAYVLHGQLSLIDPAFVHCVDLLHLPEDHNHREALRQFLHPRLTAATMQAWMAGIREAAFEEASVVKNAILQLSVAVPHAPLVLVSKAASLLYGSTWCPI